MRSLGLPHGVAEVRMGQALPRYGGAVGPAKGVQIMDVARVCDDHYANDCNA